MLPQYRSTDVLRILSRNALLKEIVQVEPNVLQMIVNAANVPALPRMTRWDAYENLKRQCQDYVGWNARNPRLSSQRHYQAMLEWIDALLPESDEYYDVLFQQSLPEWEEETV